MLVVKALVERLDPALPFAQEVERVTLEYNYADVEQDADIFLAEDEVRDQLETAGEQVICVWGETV